MDKQFSSERFLDNLLIAALRQVCRNIERIYDGAQVESLSIAEGCSWRYADDGRPSEPFYTVILKVSPMKFVVMASDLYPPAE